MKAEISDGEYCLPSRPCTQASPFAALTILYGTMPMSFWVMGSSNLRPISRLRAKNVYSGLVTACRLAACPTRRSPSPVNATTDGVVRAPSAFSMTLGAEPSMTATHELVVPRSMPITLAIVYSSLSADGLLALMRGALRSIPIEFIGKTGVEQCPHRL